MIPWILIDKTIVPGGGELRLMRRGEEFSIMLGGNELMNSRVSGSEEALARLCCEKVTDRTAPSVLIGGLGMGFTLRAAAAQLPPDARIIVSELVSGVIDWARGPMAPVFGACLADPRIEIRVGDVAEAIRAGSGAYDTIMLDVDNGPDGLTRESNDALYSAAGLRAARSALRPGGVLGIWSSRPEDAFTRRLRQAGFTVAETRARANARGGGARHTIWLGTRQ